MSTHDDDDRFRPRIGPPKDKKSNTKSKFVSRVLRESAKAGRRIGRSLPSSRGRKGKNFGRGQLAAKVAGRRLDARSRRATVKVHLVNLRQAHKRSTEQHLRYLERDGVRRDGGRGQLFSTTSDDASRREFEERVKGDRHQFRVIISPEDGAELGDLRTYTRDLMAQVERDLQTRLDWIGVEHWDTEHAHIQLVIRGKDEAGHDLLIAPEYISSGFRGRARELATEWLGPRTELEIRTSLQREVTQERWTSIDQAIQSQARDGQIVIRDESKNAEGRFHTGLQIGRLEHLSQMGLATKTAPLTYSVAPDIEATLRTMGERGDIIRTMQREITAARREYKIFDHQNTGARIVGRVAAARWVNALTDRMYLVTSYRSPISAPGRCDSAASILLGASVLRFLKRM